MAKYRELTGSESQLQRFTRAGSLDAVKKIEAEQAADNWIDQALSDWDNSRISAPGAIPPQIDEVARLVATSAYIKAEYSATGQTAGNAEDGVPRDLMREATAIINRIIDVGYVLGTHGEKITRSDCEKRSMFVPIQL